MKYITSFIFALILLLSFIMPSQVGAQALNTYKSCLKSEWCNKEGVSCPGTQTDPKKTPAVHTAKLTESDKPEDKKPLPNKNTYIVVCISHPEAVYEKYKFLCTTGDKGLDVDLYGKVIGPDGVQRDILDILGAAPDAPNYVGVSYVFDGLYTSAGQKLTGTRQLILSRGDGGIGPLEWSDHNPQPGRTRQWFSIQKYNPDEAVSATGAGHKEATFEWEAAQKSCAGIGWDPYGRVFDSETLEPVKELNIVDLWFDSTYSYKTPDVTPAFRRLLNSDVPGEPLQNPQSTDDDGIFSFVVPDNKYILKVTAPYEIEPTIAAIHPNYSYIYSDIYTPDEELLQVGKIVHRDIPIKSLKKPYREVKAYAFVIERAGTKILLSGRVSHPFAKINVETSKIMTSDKSIVPGYRVMDGGRADKDGKFSVEIDQALLDSKAEFSEVPTGANFVATDLRSITFTHNGTIVNRFIAAILRFFQPRSVKAAAISIPIDPMPSYLEGYAKDSQGVVIPKAKVGLYMKFASLPEYEMTADEQGYYKIASKYIPTSPYDIRFKSPNGTMTTITTRQYLQESQKEISTNKIDPFSVRDENNKVIPTIASINEGGNKSPVSNLNSGLKTQTASTPKTKEQSTTATPMNPAVTQTIIVLVLLLLLLGGVGVGVLLYMKKKTPQDGGF